MRKILICSVVALSVVGCATAPTGPRVAVMPAPGKPFEVFAEEDTICRHYAEQSVGQSANDNSAKSFLGAATLGTVIGATAGALSGGHSGAGSGAAVGLVGGSMIGAGESGGSMRDSQRRYDIAYEQCMYAKGNQIPGYAAPPRYAPPPPPAYAPPPPAPSAVPPDYIPPH